MGAGIGKRRDKCSVKCYGERGLKPKRGGPSGAYFGGDPGGTERGGEKKGKK